MNNVSLRHVYGVSLVSGVVAVIIAFVLSTCFNPEIGQLKEDSKIDRATFALTDAQTRLLTMQELIRLGALDVPESRQAEAEKCERDASQQLGKGEIEAARTSIQCIWDFIDEECPPERIALCGIVKDIPPFIDFDTT